MEKRMTGERNNMIILYENHDKNCRDNFQINTSSQWKISMNIDQISARLLCGKL